MENMQFCQRCGMPLEAAEHFATNADGSKNEDYCCHCYENGAFFFPEATMEEVIEGCLPHVVPEHFPDDATARAFMNTHFPTFKCWKKTGLLITFKLKDGVSTEDFLAASDKIQENYLSKCKGFISRQLMVKDGVWTDWMIMETFPDADNSVKKAMDNADAVKFVSMVGEMIEYGFYPLERSY